MKGQIFIQKWLELIKSKGVNKNEINLGMKFGENKRGELLIEQFVFNLQI
jgi:hypothetical protein